MISMGNRYTLGMGLRLHRSSEVLLTDTTVPKTCGSVVDCSLVLFSIFGLSALHQIFFSFSFYLYIFCGMGQGVIKSVPLWAM